MVTPPEPTATYCASPLMTAYKSAVVPLARLVQVIPGPGAPGFRAGLARGAGEAPDRGDREGDEGHDGEGRGTDREQV